MRIALTVAVLSVFAVISVNAQTMPSPPSEKEIRHTDGVWFGVYTKYDLSDKWAYYGEYHARFKDGMDKMGQIYLRFGMTYKVSNLFEVTAGFVNPYYWAPNPGEPNVDKVVPQYRLWQQAVLATPFDHIKVLHQLRMEQRWRRDYLKGSDFKLTHRFRYKLTVYVPLNHADFTDKTLFLSIYNEIFIQAGKTVIFNPMEDNRAFIGLGYNINHDYQVQVGYMNSFRHDGAPHLFENRHIFRLSFYHHLNLHKEKRGIPDVMIH